MRLEQTVRSQPSWPAAPHLIQRKITVPERDSRVLLRTRVNDTFGSLVEQYRVVFVRAAAGSGKTAAVLDCVTSLRRPVAWLTVDTTDAAPGRLLTYLGASLAKAVEQETSVVEQAMTNRIPHAETAGILAESISGTGTVLVVDDAERVEQSPEALEVLGAFARYLPDDCRLVVISQVDLPLDLKVSRALTDISVVEDTFLTFTVDEARKALSKIGCTGIDVEAVVAATDGWVAAVMFEAWRSSRSLLNSRDGDLLHEYLTAHILDRLSSDEKRLLIRTSLLDAVSVERAQALGIPGAARLLAGLRGKHIPATWSNHDGTMRVHTVFRTYLLRLLELEGQESERSLRRSYGLLLAAEGYFEDAVVQLVSAGDTDAAVHAIESALPDVVRRMDFEVAEHWLDLLQRYGASHHPEKVVAELMIAAGREQYWRVVQIFDEMPDEVRESVLYRTPAGAAIVAWGYWHLGRIADARAVFSRASECRETAIMRATFGVSDDVSVELPAIDTVSPALLDPLLPRIAYYCGRFGLLEQTVLNSRWAATVASAWLVGGLRATGRTHEALEHYERTLHEGTSFWLQAIAYPETLHDLDRKDEAWEALLRGRELSHQDGSQVHRVLSLLLEAKFHLRFGGDSKRARLVLDSVASIQPIAEYAFLRETRLTLQGFADLLDKQVGDAARQLSDAARSMRQGGRLLHLPTAEVLLSQALWELGDEDGSEAAADRALAAATAQGSNFLLLQALGDVPDVGTRSIDAEDDPDGPWHALGRALLTHVSSPVRCDTASVRLHDLGELRLTVAGEMVKPRIRKSLELVAYLIGQPDEAADRRAVLDALFDGRDDASTRSYLRQAVHRLREVLPPGIEVSSDKDTIQLVPVSSVDSDVRQVTRLLDQAASQRGEVRLRLLEKAIALAELGDYAADVNSDWAVARRDKLATDLNNTRYEAAVLAYRLGRYRDADGIVSTLLECDPYREQGWQLAMRLASTLGAVDRVTSIYRRCRSALAEIGLQPSAQTEQAFQESR